MIPVVSCMPQYALPPEKAKAMEHLVQEHQVLRKRTKRTFHIFPKGNMDIKAASADDLTTVGTSRGLYVHRLDTGTVPEANLLAPSPSRSPAGSEASAPPSSTTSHPGSAPFSANNTSAPGSASTAASTGGSSTSTSNAYGGLSVPHTPGVQVRSMKDSITQLGLGGLHNADHQPRALAGGHALKARTNLFGDGVPTFSASSSSLNLPLMGGGGSGSSRAPSAASSTDSLPLRPLPHLPKPSPGGAASRVPEGHLKVGPGTLKASASEPVVPRTRAITLEGRTELREVESALEREREKTRAQQARAAAHVHTHGPSPYGPRKQHTLHTFPSVQPVAEEKERQEQRAQEADTGICPKSITVSNASDSGTMPRTGKPKQRKVLPPLYIPPHPTHAQIIVRSPQPLAQPPDDGHLHPDAGGVIDISPSTLKRRSSHNRTSSAPPTPSPVDQPAHKVGQRPGTAQANLSPNARPKRKPVPQYEVAPHDESTSKPGPADDTVVAHVSAVLLTIEPPTAAVRPKEKMGGSGPERDTAATTPQHHQRPRHQSSPSSPVSRGRPYSMSKQRYVRPATSQGTLGGGGGGGPAVPPVPGMPSEDAIRAINAAAPVRMRRMSEVSIVDAMLAMEPCYRQSAVPPLGVPPVKAKASQMPARLPSAPSSPVVEKRDRKEMERRERERKEKERKEKEKRINEAKEREAREREKKEREREKDARKGSGHPSPSGSGSGVLIIGGTASKPAAASPPVEKKDAWPWAPPDSWAGPNGAAGLPPAGKPLTKSTSPATSSRSGVSTTSSSKPALGSRARGHSVSGDNNNNAKAAEKQQTHANLSSPGMWHPARADPKAKKGAEGGSSKLRKASRAAAEAEAAEHDEYSVKVQRSDRETWEETQMDDVLPKLRALRLK